MHVFNFETIDLTYRKGFVQSVVRHNGLCGLTTVSMKPQGERPIDQMGKDADGIVGLHMRFGPDVHGCNIDKRLDVPKGGLNNNLLLIRPDHLLGGHRKLVLHLFAMVRDEQPKPIESSGVTHGALIDDYGALVSAG